MKPFWMADADVEPNSTGFSAFAALDCCGRDHPNDPSHGRVCYIVDQC
jgi:hypothetical protein